MPSHFDYSDAEFVAQFARCTLDPSVFSHEAHLRLAWINIREYGLLEARVMTKKQLKNYVNHLGAEDKYNETLTIAAINAVNHFIAKSAFDNFRDFITEFPKLKTHFKALMACHYGFDIYNSPTAKATYLAPDLLPFS